MKLIKPSFEILPQVEGLNGIYKQIEIAGRTCYKSEDKITETSAKEFIDRLVKSGHGAMLEHGTVYLKVDVGKNFVTFHKKYFSNKYSVAKFIEHTNICCITTNYRVLVENGWLDDLKYICEPTEDHAKRLSVKFICDRGILCEFTRHRIFSFAAESTRYCNYSKDKFNNELTFIIPNWCNELYESTWSWEDSNPFLTAGGDVETYGYDDYSNITVQDTSNNTCWNEFKSSHHNSYQELNSYLELLQKSEDIYFDLIKQKWSPQQARSILPNSLKTELVMTGFIDDWKHFFKLRTANVAHPQARELAVPLEIYFKENTLL